MRSERNNKENQTAKGVKRKGVVVGKKRDWNREEEGRDELLSPMIAFVEGEW